MTRETKQVIQNYFKTINMTYTELKQWSKTKCSRKASLNRQPIKRNLKLLKKPIKNWNKTDLKNAKKTISFIKRMTKVNPGKPVKNCSGLTKRDISLMNWAFNPYKIG